MSEIGYTDDPYVETCKNCEYSFFINQNYHCPSCCKDYSRMVCKFDEDFRLIVSQDGKCDNFKRDVE